MALPASPLFEHFSRSAADSFARLETHGLLSDKAVGERDAIVERLHALLAEADARPELSYGERWLAFLRDERHLSAKGRAAAGPVPDAAPRGANDPDQPSPLPAPQLLLPRPTPAQARPAPPPPPPPAQAQSQSAVWPDPFAPPVTAPPAPSPVAATAARPAPSASTPPGPRPERSEHHGAFDGIAVSHRLGFPLLLDRAHTARTFLSWRGLDLAAPPQLSIIPPGIEVAVAQRFCEGDAPFLRLARPDGPGHCDWVVRWVTRDRGFALLDMAPDWPGEESQRMVAVALASPERVRTLAQRECLRALGRILPEVEDRERPLSVAEAAEAFGAFPDVMSPQVRRRQREALGAPERQACFACEKEIETDFDYCPHCGVRRQAPDCTSCGKPVAVARDVFAAYQSENGHYSWNAEWEGRCEACGIDVSLRAELPATHAHVARMGPSIVEVTGEESADVVMDEWDHLPVVRVRVTREMRGARAVGKLAAEAEITLTHDELAAVTEALRGPLRVLLERKRWSRGLDQ